MKKSFALLTIVLLMLSAVTFNLQAQYASKGIVELGGAISYSSTTVVTNGTAASESTSLFNFMPYASYFIINGFSVGVSPGINIVKLAGSSNAISNLLFFVIPSYTFSTKSDVFPFVQAWVGYTSLTSNADATSGTPELDLSGLTYGGRGGIKVMVGKNGLLSVGVSYMLYTLNPKGADKRSGMNTLSITMDYSVFIGK